MPSLFMSAAASAHSPLTPLSKKVGAPKPPVPSLISSERLSLPWFTLTMSGSPSPSTSIGVTPCGELSQRRCRSWGRTCRRRCPSAPRLRPLDVAPTHRSLLPSLSKSAGSLGLASSPIACGVRIDPKFPVPSARFRNTRTSALTSFTVVRSQIPVAVEIGAPRLRRSASGRPRCDWKLTSSSSNWRVDGTVAGHELIEEAGRPQRSEIGAPQVVGQRDAHDLTRGERARPRERHRLIAVREARALPGRSRSSGRTRGSSPA